MSFTLSRLLPLLRHEESEARRVALSELVALRAPGVVEAFVATLGDDDWRVRKEAASLTPRVEPRDELLVALARALDDKENIGLRNAAVEALVSLGPDAVPVALAAFDALDADGRKLAVEVLAGVPDPRGVERLIRGVGDSDSNVAHASAEALGRAGLASEDARRRATAALAACLDRDDIPLVLAALESLVRLDARIPYARLLPLSRQPLLRRAAIAAAAHSREEPALGVLVEATASSPATVAREATIALARWLDETPPGSKLASIAGERLRTVAGVHERLRHAALDEVDSELRGAALVLLGAVRERGDVVTLVGAAQDEEVSNAAMRGLEIFGPDAGPGLGALLEVADPPIRTTLLTIIAALGAPIERERLRIVREWVLDSAADVAAAAAALLAQLGDERDLGRLVSLTAHNDPRVAEAATAAVGTLAVRHPEAARALLGALDPTAEHAAAGAAIVAALASREGAAAREDLVSFGERALRSADARARRLAIEALAASGDASVADTIALSLADEERDVRLSAVRALGALGAAGPLRALVRESSDEETVSVALRALSAADLATALEVARELVRGSDAALASTAVEVLSRPPGAERARGLLLALEHADKDVVALALAELGPDIAGAGEEVFARVADCLTHPAWEVRRLASELLGQGRSPEARALLRARLEHELEPAVREVLQGALSIRPPRGPADGDSQSGDDGSDEEPRG